MTVAMVDDPIPRDRRWDHGIGAEGVAKNFGRQLGGSASLSAIVLVAALAGCGGTPKRSADSPVIDRAGAPPSSTPARPARSSRAGGYYLDDGPGDSPPPNIDAIPDAVPRSEPLRRAANRPYEVMGRSYTPETSLRPYRARGLASWYGRRYHGKQTSSGEVYDMYAMTAAHTTLPIPSYARVTSIATGKSVVVRVNDRGPFHPDRIVDLSYTAAYKLGLLGGVAMVEVESVSSGTALVAATTATTPASVQAQPLPTSTGAGGVFLQLGAFGTSENAHGYADKLRAQLEWLTEALQVVTANGLYRVHAGPYGDRGSAQQAADRIAQTLGTRPFVLTR